MILLLFIGCFGLFSCKTPQTQMTWEMDLHTAEHLLNTDQYDAAQVAYIELLETALVPSDRHYVLYCLGLIAERKGDISGAIDYFSHLYESLDPELEHPDEYAARALYRLGWLYYDNLEAVDEGIAVWKQVVRNFHELDGPSIRSLDALVSHYDDSDKHDEAIQYFSEEFLLLAETRIGDNLLFWLAYWHQYYLDEPELAFEYYQRLREEYYNSSGLRDNAEWEMIQILHEAADYQRELQLLDEMRGERTPLVLFGPDATGSMEEAAFRMGQVYLENLDDPEGAIREWHSFLDIWSVSLKRDDAIYGIVLACQTLVDRVCVEESGVRLIEDYPDSRWRDEVEIILGL